MAKKVITQLIDDIDGKDADETVTFALDGTTYELDLSAKNADKFRGLFQDYIAAGRKVGKTGRRTAAKSSNAAEIRAWAQSNGIEVPARGRIPQEVRDQFEAAS